MSNKITPSVLLWLLLLACWSLPAQSQTRFNSLNYLYSIKGKQILSGQHNDQKNLECGSSGATGANYWTNQVFNITGKYPALYSGDFLFHGSSQLRWDITYEAERQWNAGAVVNIMWHSCPPTIGASCGWDPGVIGNLSSAQFAELLTNGSNLNTIWKNRVNEIAVHLRYLRDKGVEVMWRPYHEQNQTVFWWNSQGPENTKALWRMMHHYMTNDLGLDNLIWVWDIQDIWQNANFANYNPGSQYWDVMALDIYADGYSNSMYYNNMLAVAGSKPIAIGECFRLPSAQVINNYPQYTFFMNWAYGLKKDLNCNESNSDAYIREVYNNPKVITRDEMPGWRNPVPDNLAKGKSVTVSSTEAGANVAANAVDGNYGTRWSSLYSDPQWLQVDLGGNYEVNRVKITWEVALGRDYQIQISPNGSSWTNLRTVTGNTSTVNDYTSLSGSGRYIRINGTARATTYGYSIFELEVYGTPAAVPQSPYSGTPVALPGTIQAENYDLGGEGVAYHDNAAGNSFNTYRNDGVDIENCTDAGAGYNLGNVAAGEWTEYSVNVTAAGTYAIDLRVATVNAGRYFHLELDGTNISGNINVPNTGGWQSWQTVTVNNVSLSAGQKVLRVYMDTDLFNLNSIVFKNATTPPNLPPAVSIASPNAGSSFNAPASVTITANASDNDGTVTKVDFYNGSTLLASDNTAPYSFVWNNVSAGNYTLTARATDNANATTISASVNITVTNVNTNLCSGIPSFVENAGYVTGSKVQNAGALYECKPWPYSGWCNGAAWAYAPGTGAYWADAWTKLGNCNGARQSNEATTLAVSIAPVPAEDYITIHFDAFSHHDISLIDVFGKEVTSVKNFRSGDQLSLEKLTPGMYLLRVNDNTYTVIKK